MFLSQVVYCFHFNFIFPLGALLKCQNCDFETTQQIRLEKHIKTVHPDVAVILGYMTKQERDSRGPEEVKKDMGDLMMSSDMYTTRIASTRVAKKCPFCPHFSSFTNDRLVNHIKKYHSEISEEEMNKEIGKLTAVKSK